MVIMCVYNSDLHSIVHLLFHLAITLMDLSSLPLECTDIEVFRTYRVARRLIINFGFLQANVKDAASTTSITGSNVSLGQIAVAYVAAQLTGAVLAGASVLAVFDGAIRDYERANNITRGDEGSARSAMAFGQYMPNPAAGCECHA